MPGPRPVSIAVHLWIVAYDIADDSRRTRVAELLEGRGQRVQFSVFECRLNDREMTRLRRKVAGIADERCDRVRWYPLCGPCSRKTLGIGSDLEADPSGGEGFVIL